jgi:hypothetical protein
MFHTKAKPADPPAPDKPLTPVQAAEVLRQHEAALRAQQWHYPSSEAMRPIAARQMADVLDVRNKLAAISLEQFIQASRDRSSSCVKHWLHRECLIWGRRKGLHAIAIEDFEEWQNLVLPLLDECGYGEAAWSAELRLLGRGL